MSLDNPARYDLAQPNSDDAPGAPAMMESRRNGDWVSYSDYEDLLKAHDELAARLERIADIAR